MVAPYRGRFTAACCTPDRTRETSSRQRKPCPWTPCRAATRKNIPRTQRTVRAPPGLARSRTRRPSSRRSRRAAADLAAARRLAYHSPSSSPSPAAAMHPRTCISRRSVSAGVAPTPPCTPRPLASGRLPGRAPSSPSRRLRPPVFRPYEVWTGPSRPRPRLPPSLGPRLLDFITILVPGRGVYPRMMNLTNELFGGNSSGSPRCRMKKSPLLMEVLTRRAAPLTQGVGLRSVGRRIYHTKTKGTLELT